MFSGATFFNSVSLTIYNFLAGIPPLAYAMNRDIPMKTVISPSPPPPSQFPSQCSPSFSACMLLFLHALPPDSVSFDCCLCLQLENNPRIYSESQKSRGMNAKTFMWWVVLAVVQVCVCVPCSRETSFAACMHTFWLFPILLCACIFRMMMDELIPPTSYSHNVAFHCSILCTKNICCSLCHLFL